MRIRKRQVPLPFSSLSPVPLSDPLLHRTPVVQLQHNATISPPKASNPPQNLSHGGDTAHHVSLRPSDRANQHLSPIGEGSNAWDSVDDAGCGAPNKNNGREKKLQRVEDDGDEEEGEKRNDTRERTIFGAETSYGFLPESSSSDQVVGRWCEREKAFPLKKRRGNFERRENEDSAVNLSEKEKKMMKTKMNKKCSQKQEEEESKLGINHVNSSTGGGGGGKKRSRGGALMEGSRCSRVNGRGWRCCQQTLVGYSLCEHHLGKGRLRSMNSVRSRSLAANKKELPAHRPQPEPLSSLSSSLSQERNQKKSSDTVEEEDEKKPLSSAATKKRMKLGVVKARSISSLLGQTDNVMAAAPPPPDDNVKK